MSTTAATEITVYLNGEKRALAAPVTVLGALRELGLAERKGIALAINDSVVPRSQWATRALAPGERLLVIQATQGG